MSGFTNCVCFVIVNFSVSATVKNFNCKLNNQGISTIKKATGEFLLKIKMKGSVAVRRRGIRINIFGQRAILNVPLQHGGNITAAIMQNGVLMPK